MDTANTVERIVALEERRRSAMLGADLRALETLCSAGLRYVHSRGELDDRIGYLDKVARRHFVYHALSFEIDTVDPIDGGALVHGRVRGVVDVASEARHLDCRYMAVWANEAGAWRLRAYQATPITTADGQDGPETTQRAATC